MSDLKLALIRLLYSEGNTPNHFNVKVKVIGKGEILKVKVNETNTYHNLCPFIVTDITCDYFLMEVWDEDITEIPVNETIELIDCYLSHRLISRHLEDELIIRHKKWKIADEKIEFNTKKFSSGSTIIEYWTDIYFEMDTLIRENVEIGILMKGTYDPSIYLRKVNKQYHVASFDFSTITAFDYISREIRSNVTREMKFYTLYQQIRDMNNRARGNGFQNLLIKSIRKELEPGAMLQPSKCHFYAYKDFSHVFRRDLLKALTEIDPSIARKFIKSTLTKVHKEIPSRLKEKFFKNENLLNLITNYIQESDRGFLILRFLVKPMNTSEIWDMIGTITDYEGGVYPPLEIMKILANDEDSSTAIRFKELIEDRYTSENQYDIYAELDLDEIFYQDLQIKFNELLINEIKNVSPFKTGKKTINNEVLLLLSRFLTTFLEEIFKKSSDLATRANRDEIGVSDVDLAFSENVHRSYISKDLSLNLKEVFYNIFAEKLYERQEKKAIIIPMETLQHISTLLERETNHLLSKSMAFSKHRKEDNVKGSDMFLTIYEYRTGSIPKDERKFEEKWNEYLKSGKIILKKSNDSIN
ncbi:MAG: hypothetical protein EAX96_07480 [Candidatus Lokiarchaeota archaeon]|nr:hypothetical protein [Candidatus Lokiarchaeota archaeon]